MHAVLSTGSIYHDMRPRGEWSPSESYRLGRAPVPTWTGGTASIPCVIAPHGANVSVRSLDL